MSNVHLLRFLENYITNRRKELFKKVASGRTRHFTIVLENIYQSHNASAVVRSCECFGIQDIYIIEKEHRFKANSGIVMGANKWVDFNHFKNPSECIAGLREKGYLIAATMPNPDEPGDSKNNYLLETFPINKKTAFFFGEESIGLSGEVIRQADAFLKIPMFGFTESFNISVTAAIVMHHLVMKMKKSKKINWRLPEEEQIKLRTGWAIKSIKKGDELYKYFKNNQHH